MVETKAVTKIEEMAKTIVKGDRQRKLSEIWQKMLKNSFSAKFFGFAKYE
jgi:hypothetical protein